MLPQQEMQRHEALFEPRAQENLVRLLDAHKEKHDPFVYYLGDLVVKRPVGFYVDTLSSLALDCKRGGALGKQAAAEALAYRARNA